MVSGNKIKYDVAMIIVIPISIFFFNSKIRCTFMMMVIFISILLNTAVQHERGPRTSTVRRQLQGLCYSKDSSGSNSPPLDLTPKRSPESSTTCSTPPSRYIPDSHLYLSAFRPQVDH